MRDTLKEVDDFVEVLALETKLNREGSKDLVCLIFRHTGQLDTAKSIYKESSIEGLTIYIEQLLLGAVY